MNSGLFRKKSMERISSPEELHDYMRVTSPRLWMLLGAVAALLIGFIAYASTATIENTMPIKVRLEAFKSFVMVDEGVVDTNETVVTSTLPLTLMDVMNTGMEVRFGDDTGHVEWFGVMEETGDISLIINMARSYYPLPDGEYDAELVLESTTPISFLWN